MIADDERREREGAAVVTDDDLGKMCGDLWSSCGLLVARKVEGDKASFNPVSEMVSWWGIDSPWTKDDPARMEMIADIIKAIL